MYNCKVIVEDTIHATSIFRICGTEYPHTCWMLAVHASEFRRRNHERPIIRFNGFVCVYAVFKTSDNSKDTVEHLFRSYCIGHCEESWLKFSPFSDKVSRDGHFSNEARTRVQYFTKELVRHILIWLLGISTVRIYQSRKCILTIAGNTKTRQTYVLQERYVVYCKAC